MDRPATAADAAAFQARTLEATARSEEVVVGMEARVVEEIAVAKQTADRVETVRDTVRRTEVDVEDGSATTRTDTTNVAGGVGTSGGKPTRK